MSAHSDPVVGSPSAENVSSSMITSMVNEVNLDQQESARSRVLKNEDLLGVIMKLMEEPPPSLVLFNTPKPNRRYFLWASLACKAFFGPAMNILWHSVFSLEVIIKLIPTLKKDEHNCYNMTQAILPEHLERFELYTRRIRKFTFPSEEGLNFSVSPHVYLAIAKLRRMQPFASLTELFIPKAGLLAHFPGIFLLCSQTLDSVYLYGIGNEHAVVMSLLQDISSKECNVQTMGIRGKLTSTFLDTLSTFKYLKAVSVVNDNPELTTEEFLRPFSCLKTLTNLLFTFGKDSKLAFPKNQGGRKPLVFKFPALEILTVTGSTSNITAILQSMFPPELVDVRVIITSMEETPMAIELCAKIIRSWEAAHLRALQFFSDDFGEFYTDYYVLSYQMFGLNRKGPVGRPLSSGGLSHIFELQVLCPLESVYLEMYPNILNPSILHIFESSFTSLNRLVLRSSIPSLEHLSSTDEEHLMPLSEMEIFASHFPNLKDLTICTVFDLKKMKEMKEKSSNPNIGGHHLRELVLLPFPHHAASMFADITSVMEAFGVARYLDHLFPTMKLDLSKCVKINTTWREAVQDMVKEFQEVRRIASSRSLVQSALTGSSLNSATGQAVQSSKSPE